MPLPLLGKVESAGALGRYISVVSELWTEGCPLCAKHKTGWPATAVLVPIRYDKRRVPCRTVGVTETKHKAWTE